MNRHLLPGEIIEAATRQLADYELIGHLSTCAGCKAKIEQYRATRMAVVPANATQASAPGPDCPPMERLAFYSAGHRDPELAGHIATCDRCAWIVGDALEAGTEAAPKRRRKRRRLLLPGIVAGLVIVSAGAFFLLRPPAKSAEPKGVDTNEGITEMLARAYSEIRPFEFRLDDAGYIAIRPPAANDRNGFVIGAAAAVGRRLLADPNDLAAIALKGRAALLLGDYQQAITLLTRALDVWPDDPTPRRDLAGALVMRGQKESRPEDFEQAILLLRKVLEQHPADKIVSFDLALAYEKAFRAAEAAEQWRGFVGNSPGPGWLEEGNRHLAALEKIIR